LLCPGLFSFGLSALTHAPGGGRNSNPNFFAIAITHHQDAVYPATIVGIPPMEDFYIGGANVKLFLPIALTALGIFQPAASNRSTQWP
jgi:UbiD family decarboxylase